MLATTSLSDHKAARQSGRAGANIFASSQRQDRKASTVSEFLELHIDGGEWRACLLGNDFPIVEADDCYILGNADAFVPQGIDNSARNLVIPAKDRVRLFPSTGKDRVNSGMAPFLAPVAIEDFRAVTDTLSIGIGSAAHRDIVVGAGYVEDARPAAVLQMLDCKPCGPRRL